MLEAPFPRIRTSQIHTNPIKSVNRLNVVNVVTFSCICVDWGWLLGRDALGILCDIYRNILPFLLGSILKAATSNCPPPSPYLTHSGAREVPGWKEYVCTPSKVNFLTSDRAATRIFHHSLLLKQGFSLMYHNLLSGWEAFGSQACRPKYGDYSAAMMFHSLLF